MEAQDLSNLSWESPAKTPTETRWKIEFGKTQTNAGKTLEGEKQGGKAIGDYEENALVVGEVL